MVTQGSGPVHQHGKYRLFVGRVVVVAVGIEIEVSVCGLVADSVA
jgi:hypothetical protein